MIIDYCVEMIELQAEAFGSKTTLYPTIIWDETSAVLIDTGMPGGWKQIRELMRNNYIPLNELKAIILTHQDLDHIGSVEEIKQELGEDIIVYAHEYDKPYIEGDLPLIKSTPAMMEKLIDTLPENLKKDAMELCTNPPKAKVDQTITDGQILPYCGGIQVIHTPGHTEGHVSLYLQESKILVAADALMCINGKLHGPVQQTSLDLQKAQRSVAKFLDYEIESVVCYHGGFCEFRVKEQIEELVQKFNA